MIIDSKQTSFQKKTTKPTLSGFHKFLDDPSRWLLRPDEFPMGALARYERDVAAMDYIIARSDEESSE